MSILACVGVPVALVAAAFAAADTEAEPGTTCSITSLHHCAADILNSTRAHRQQPNNFHKRSFTVTQETSGEWEGESNVVVFESISKGSIHSFFSRFQFLPIDCEHTVLVLYVHFKQLQHNTVILFCSHLSILGIDLHIAACRIRHMIIRSETQ